MPGSSKSMSFSDFAPVSSLDSVQESEGSSSKSKGREVAQAMLAEVEEHLKEFDRDLQALHSKAHAYQGSWPDIPLGSAEISSPVSHETCMGATRSRLSWELRDSLTRRIPSSVSQSCPEETPEATISFLTLIRNIYRIVSTEIAPKMQVLIKEVTQLRKNNELLSERVEQQRQRHNEQMEEFEDLQLELRAKDAQLREQRRVSKSLDIYQGENEMLKVKLNNLLVRVGKMEGSSVTQSAVRETQDKPDMPFKRASSNEWLRQENEDLQREVNRLRSDASEKEAMISQLKKAIKNFTANDSPRSPVQRKLSVAPRRPESIHSPVAASSRSSPEAMPLDAQIGAALAMETPRGRMRSSIFGKLSPFSMSTRAPSVTTLAQDLGMKLPSTAANTSQEQPTPVPSARRSSLRGSLSPPTKSAPEPTAESGARVAGSKEDAANLVDGLPQWLQAKSEAMERALFELEEIRILRIKEESQWQSKMAHGNQLLMLAEEKLSALTAEVEDSFKGRRQLLGERLQTLGEMSSVRKQLEAVQREAAELKGALEGSQRKAEQAQKDARDTVLRLTESINSAEDQIAMLQERNTIFSELVLSLSSYTKNILSKLQRERSGKFIERAAGFDAEVTSRSCAEVQSMKTPRTADIAKDGGHSTTSATHGKQQQPHRATSLGEKLRVVLNTKNDTCCSPLGCLSLWNTSTAMAAQPAVWYSFESPSGSGEVSWHAQKPHSLFKAAKKIRNT
ncbi:hypothetical protein ETH_00030370 [Eimeria tenella]|uniref:Myosin heavy chain n=1 Tax=Eimeria tenella TaxID=5802 RepID=U6KRG2_EIMTE|nr:hypothetical protein ETH_00030370 [Eimeria tenella]CDJ38028.1 hypothetical protein ETH_00030370 [Eimeria tenella]|eukprot:XP_013228866.1 hypothetical protein ETH_00030370 [Eimeria tenella]